MQLISNPKELYRFLAAADIEVCSMQFASDKVVWITWRYAEAGSVPNLPHTNDDIVASSRPARV
jgi:hypothetical protein